MGMRTGVALLLALITTMPAAAQASWQETAGLTQDRGSAATVKLTIPFGGTPGTDRSIDKARLSFGLDYSDAYQAYDQRLALGFTFDGEMLLETGHITLTQRELMAAMNADGEEGEDGGGNLVPWIIGGVVVAGVVTVGLTAVFVNEYEDAIDDSFDCAFGDGNCT